MQINCSGKLPMTAFYDLFLSTKQSQTANKYLCHQVSITMSLVKLVTARCRCVHSRIPVCDSANIITSVQQFHIKVMRPCPPAIFWKLVLVQTKYRFWRLAGRTVSALFSAVRNCCRCFRSTEAYAIYQ